MNIQQNRITALYCRLSRDDDFGGDSVSIQTQKTMLSQYARDNACAVLAIWDCASLPELADSNGRLSDGGWVYPVDSETLETLLERYRDVYPMESYAPDGAAKTAAIVLYEQ